jgi:hypothetical protein
MVAVSRNSATSRFNVGIAEALSATLRRVGEQAPTLVPALCDANDAYIATKDSPVYNEVRPHSAIGDRTPMSLIHAPPRGAQQAGDSQLNRSNFWDAPKQPPDSQ